MGLDKPERRLAGPARTYIEAGYAIEVDILRVEDGNWGALVRLSRLADGAVPAAHFMLKRTFEDRAMAFSYTLALTRECVLQFAPAAADKIARLLGGGETED
ncbi:hypothetical protein P3W85_18560 [Cupriavidus basilensis]|uniref:Uncharacterized protein n=1 Tax=Cupriavidus basilensis TaxID=68895 RepID=A0ABT6AQQ9_9BURK|nr:hypothetical protein [Cupriavidus basilensis]MDF3834946.1 hypothetical protein [Cupriavidus basilensis]